MAASAILSFSSSFLDQQVHFLTFKCQSWIFQQNFYKMQIQPSTPVSKKNIMNICTLLQSQQSKQPTKALRVVWKPVPTFQYIGKFWAEFITWDTRLSSSVNGILSKNKIQAIHVYIHTLQKAQQTQDIVYFDSFNTFSSKQKLQQTLKSWSNFSSVLFGKGRNK